MADIYIYMFRGHICIYICTIYKPSERALSLFKDASRKRAALDTDKARSQGL